MNHGFDRWALEFDRVWFNVLGSKTYEKLVDQNLVKAMNINIDFLIEKYVSNVKMTSGGEFHQYVEYVQNVSNVVTDGENAALVKHSLV